MLNTEFKDYCGGVEFTLSVHHTPENIGFALIKAVSFLGQQPLWRSAYVSVPISTEDSDVVCM